MKCTLNVYFSVTGEHTMNVCVCMFVMTFCKNIVMKISRSHLPVSPDSKFCLYMLFVLKSVTLWLPKQFALFWLYIFVKLWNANPAAIRVWELFIGHIRYKLAWIPLESLRWSDYICDMLNIDKWHLILVDQKMSYFACNPQNQKMIWFSCLMLHISHPF